MTPTDSVTRTSSAQPPAGIDTTVSDPARLTADILTRLDDDKAEDIVRIDLDGKSSFADDMIIASGRSATHVKALADHIVRDLKARGHGRVRVEGLASCDWVLIDAGDVVVHIFRPEVRSFYDLERIWSDGPAASGHLGT